jgi:hypothetical protein
MLKDCQAIKRLRGNTLCTMVDFLCNRVKMSDGWHFDQVVGSVREENMQEFKKRSHLLL